MIKIYSRILYTLCNRKPQKITILRELTMKIGDSRYKFARKSARRAQVSTRRKVTCTYPVLFIDIPDFALPDKKVETSGSESTCM